MKYLLDSNILIYHLNGEKIASDFLSDNISKCAISRITYVEVLSFDFSEEEASEVKELLENFVVCDTNAAIGAIYKVVRSFISC
ncbi:MAG: PIN domain-containing protein [Desulfobacterales bacterium]